MTIIIGRKKSICQYSNLSDPLKVGDQGAAQGSLLGLLCFIIFYNDFPAVRDTGSIVLYADDNSKYANPEALKTKGLSINNISQ